MEISCNKTFTYSYDTNTPNKTPMRENVYSAEE